MIEFDKSWLYTSLTQEIFPDLAAIHTKNSLYLIKTVHIYVYFDFNN